MLFNWHSTYIYSSFLAIYNFVQSLLAYIEVNVSASVSVSLAASVYIFAIYACFRSSLVGAYVGAAVGAIVIGILAGVHAVRQADAGPAAVEEVQMQSVSIARQSI